MIRYSRKHNFDFDIDLLCDLRKEMRSFFCCCPRAPFSAYQIIIVKHTEVKLCAKLFSQSNLRLHISVSF